MARLAEIIAQRKTQRDDVEEKQAVEIEFVIPEGSERISLRRHLFFSIAGFNFCVPLIDIMSVVNVGDVLVDMDLGVSLPPICKGFIRVQRQEVPLLDLRPKFGIPPGIMNDGANALLIDFGVTYLALLVDFVFNVEGGEEGYRLPVPRNISGLGGDFLVDYVVYATGGAYRMNIQTMFNEEDLEALSNIL